MGVARVDEIGEDIAVAANDIAALAAAHAAIVLIEPRVANRDPALPLVGENSLKRAAIRSEVRQTD